MANWYKNGSNLLRLFAVVMAVLAAGTALGLFDRQALTAHPQVLEVGEISAGDTLSLTFKLRNHRGTPTRLLGAFAT